MAIAFVASADGGNNGGSTNSLTFSYTCGSGSNRLLIVVITGDYAAHDDITGVTYNSVAMTLAVKKIASGSTTRNVYIYYLLNPASGSHSVAISSTANHYLLAGAADYTGVLQSGQPDATATNDSVSNATTLTTSITTVADNAWPILAESGYQNNTAPTAGSGSTRRTFDATFGTWGIFDSNSAVHPAGAYSMTTGRNVADSPIMHAIASFSPAGAGGGFGALISENFSKLIGGGLVLA